MKSFHLLPLSNIMPQPNRQHHIADGQDSGPLQIVQEKLENWRVKRLASFPLEDVTEATEAHGLALKEETGIAVKVSEGTCVTCVQVAGRRLCVKQFVNLGFWIGSKDLIRPSHARRSWRASLLLRELGIGAPLALALLERQRGKSGDAFLVMEQIEDAVPVHDFARERLAGQGLAERKRFIEDAAAFLRKLHASPLYHSDLKASNLLVRERGGGFEFFLVDLAAIRRRGPTTAARRLHNLAQLHASVGKYVPWTDRLRFFRACLAGDSRYSDERAALADLAKRTARRGAAW